MDKLTERVRKTIKEHHMVKPGDRVMAALSGGADSVCLLRILVQLRDILGIRLRAVHVHHGLRGEEADRDSRFAEELCRELSVPFSLIYADVRGLADREGISEEEAGRILRYESFESEGKKWESEEPGAGTSSVKTAVAHHSGDQAETILHNLFRGSGLGGLKAIAKFGFDPRVYQTTVKEFYKNEAGQVCGALISKLKSEVVDGRRQMVPTGEEFTVDCDLVLIAAGFTGCEPYVADAFGVERTKRGTVADVKYATADPKVFACGDMRRGQSLVVWALREGRDTAAVVDEKLMGYTNL